MSRTEEKLKTLNADIKVAIADGRDPNPLWECFKWNMVADTVSLSKQCRKRMTAGHRQRMHRLMQKLRRCSGDNNQLITQRRQELVDQIRIMQQRRLELRRRTLQSNAADAGKARGRKFYQRVSNKYSNNYVPRLQTSNPKLDTPTAVRAQILADAWEPVLNKVPSTDGSLRDYLQDTITSDLTNDYSDLDDQIADEEVREAIRRCSRGKAHGPDRLGNDWYRDHEDTLVPVLAALFNYCFVHKATPTSFQQAFIFRLKKVDDPSDPLNYRPIALLNTDYKVYTRIFATRLSRHLASLVHSTQFGFVPGRSIHTAIDLFESAKQVCAESEELSGAQVVFLDFLKAYDSLHRPFIHEVLEQKGIPPRFRAMIVATHTGTAATFLANGFHSRAVQVTSGIRQGYTLAPMIFVVVIDPLYNAIEMDPEIDGIMITKQGMQKKFTVTRYADDTSPYLRKSAM
jgi:hypothetical protein